MQSEPSGEARNDGAPIHSSQSGLSGQRGAGQRILLVEDHLPTLQVLARLLRRDGHEVVEAVAVADAVAQAKGRQFDLLISDLGLPDGSGNDLMVALRKSHGLKGIALTGYGMEKDIEESKVAGFAAHATKPVELTTVRRLIAQVLLGPACAGESLQGCEGSPPPGPH